VQDVAQPEVVAVVHLSCGNVGTQGGVEETRRLEDKLILAYKTPFCDERVDCCRKFGVELEPRLSLPSRERARVVEVAPYAFACP
jgi:hypothetical protein